MWCNPLGYSTSSTTDSWSAADQDHGRHQSDEFNSSIDSDVLWSRRWSWIPLLGWWLSQQGGGSGQSKLMEMVFVGAWVAGMSTISIQPTILVIATVQGVLLMMMTKQVVPQAGAAAFVDSQGRLCWWEYLPSRLGCWQRGSRLAGLLAMSNAMGN